MPDLTASNHLTFLGTGEAFDHALPTTSILCSLGPLILVDCGYTIPPLLWRAVPDPDALDALYLTHLHGDHVFGVPSILYRAWEDGRKRPLTIIGHRGTQQHLTRILRLAYCIGWNDLSFPVEFRVAEPGVPLRFRGVRLTFARSRHPITNLAVRFDWQGNPFAISGDGSPTPQTRALFTGCALLIHESFQDEVFQPVHASLPIVLDVARQAGVERVGLVHLSRRFRGNVRAALKRYKSSRLKVFVPRPGQTVVI